jgi:hypothetical protein
MQQFPEKGFGLITLIILVLFGMATEIYFISTHQRNLTDDITSTNRKFTLYLAPPTPSPKSRNKNPTTKISPKYITAPAQSNPQPIFTSNTVQVVSGGSSSQSISQTNYQLTANLFCSNPDPQVSTNHLDMEIGFSAQDSSKAYYYVMITESASGKTVYGPYTGGDPATSASYDAIYHGSVSGLFTNTSDLVFTGDGRQYTVKLYKSSDPLINGSQIKQVSVSKTCSF